MRPRILRAAYFLAAPLVCLAVFWRGPLIWFVNDDFAWLSLHLQVHGLHDLAIALFSPQAQGTVRVFSERLFFLVFGWLFGLHALPFRIWVLATWFADLTLANLIGARLTGSRLAGLIAALLWTVSACIATPLDWASAYNEVLCAFCILGAFYARLRWIESGRRRWSIAEWVLYLAGFGALEVMVMYPALIALHALCTERKRLRNTAPFFIPAIAFTLVHFLLIPKNPGAYYNLIVDHRLPKTFLIYLAAAIGPGQFDDLLAGPWIFRGIVITAAIGLAVLIFVIARWRRQQWIALFYCGWFVLLLAPVLPLPNHMDPYYLTMPVLGLAWLGGWGIASAWSSGYAARVAALILAALFVRGSLRDINTHTRFDLERASRFHGFILALENVARAHPGTAVMLQGVDNDLFTTGFEDDPFLLIGMDRVYLLGDTSHIQWRRDLGGFDKFLISPSVQFRLIEHGQARALDVSAGGLRDITAGYEAKLRADPEASRQEMVDVGDPYDAPLLGPTWYGIEQGFRWMPKQASVTLSGTASPSAKLYAAGYAPEAALAAGPLTLRFRADGQEIGSALIGPENARFSLQFPMPAGLAGLSKIEITVEVSRTFHPPGETRELGVIFGTFAIR